MFKIGFFGAGPHDGAGNQWFNQIMDASGIPLNRRYAQDDGNRALADLLRALDQNRNRIITAKELENVTIKVTGYSWGGAAAAGLALKISTPGIKVVGGPRDTYDLRVAIPVAVVVLVDPVDILNTNIIVPNTVSECWNYYQRRGGYAIFRNPDGTEADPDLNHYGNPISAALKGTSVNSSAGSGDQVRIDTLSPVTEVLGKPFASFQPPGNSNIELLLRSSEVNHDVMPWFAQSQAVAKLI